MDPDRPLLCPSAEPRAGHLVIGAVTADGSVAHLRTPLVADEATVAPDPTGRTADQRLRFAAPCQTSGCGQWSGGRCSVPGAVALVLSETRRADDTAPPDAAATRDPHDGPPLPRCAIRAQCRWFAESGAEACRLCPLVVRRGDAPTRSPAPPASPTGAAVLSDPQ